MCIRDSSGTLDGTILDARVGTVYAAIQMGEEQDSSILILDSSGRQVENISMDGQTVLDFGFFNNDSLLWVMTLNTDGTVPMSTITTYRPGKMLLGAVEDNQQVLYEVVFQASQIRAVGTTHIGSPALSGQLGAGGGGRHIRLDQSIRDGVPHGGERSHYLCAAHLCGRGAGHYRQ